MRAPRAFVRYARAIRAEPFERCALCAEPLPETHRHLIDRREGGVACACRACALRFDEADAASRYRAVPDRVLVDPSFDPTAEDWATVGVPVRLAFLVRTPDGAWRAFLPGPAGVTEAEPVPEAMEALAGRTRLVELLEPEVEALLLWGERGASTLACLLVPVDRCWALAGAVRGAWEGIDGGDAVRREIQARFAELRARARQVEAP